MAEEGAEPPPAARASRSAEAVVATSSTASGALEHVAEQRRCGEPLVAGAQHVGRADIAGADRADVAGAGEPRQNQAERNRAER